MKSIYFFLLFTVLTTAISFSQSTETYTLENCYQLAETNFPLTQQRDVITAVTDESIRKIGTYWQPQVYVNAQATYQSDVTQLPISFPGIEIPVLSKDQYKATLDINQMLYDGGIVHQQKELQLSGSEIEKQKIEVEIYKLREKINQLYFIILQADKNIALVNNLQNELNNQKQKIKAGIQFGTASQNSADILDAELIKADQKLIEVRSARESAVLMLSRLIGQPITPSALFKTPEVEFNMNDTLNVRPEVKLFDLQEQQLGLQIHFAQAPTLPKLSLFAQGGYGKPGLNFLDDEFSFYYIGGIKLSYPLWTGNTKKYDRNIYSMNITSSQIYRQNFILNSSILTSQYTGEIKKLGQLIEKDLMLIGLKKKLTSSASLQLENGIISANDYVSFLNQETEANINLATHEIQLLAAQINYMITLGKIK